MGKWIGKFWGDLSSNGEVYGKPFVFLGLLIFFSLSILIAIGKSIDLGLLNMAFATISFGLGMIALGRGTKSEQQMRAIANLQFDEKVVAMENYMDGLSNPNFTSDFLESEYRKFLWDLRSMALVARWVDETRRQEAGELLNIIKEHLEGKMDPARLSEVKKLCSEVCPINRREDTMVQREVQSHQESGRNPRSNTTDE